MTAKKKDAEYYEIRKRLKETQAKYVIDKKFRNKDTYNDKVWKGWRSNDGEKHPVIIRTIEEIEDDENQ